jgi:NodT family efflux transporter outer membrane factor (OMF) lipoprotein
MLRNLITVLFLAFGLAVALNGHAATGGSYTPPPVDAPEVFDSVPPGLVEQVDQEDVRSSPWWTRFDDPVLTALVGEALENNLDLREAVARVEAARAYRSEASQEYLPNGGLTASQQHLSIARERSRTAAVGIEVGWEIDLFGRIRNMNRAARANAEMNEELLSHTRVVIAAEVARTYFALRAAEARVEMLERYHADQLEIVALVEARVEEGIDDAANLARARAAAAGDLMALANERHAVRALRNALAVLLGRPPIGHDVPPAAAQGSLILQPIAIGDPAALLQRRPDVRAAERRLAAETAEIGVATAGLFPQLNLAGFFGFAAGSFGNLVGSKNESWLGGPVLTWGVFDLGRVRAQIRRERAEAEGTLAAYEQTVLRALEDSQNAFSAFGAAQESLGASDEQARNARIALDLVGAQYEEGVVAYFDLLDARRTSLRAEIARIDSLTSHRTATVDVFRALGIEPSGQEVE